MPSLVLLRHGQSVWNKSNRFTGWTDVDLSRRGVFEARRAGRYLLESGIPFDIAYTSLLKRAVRSLWLVLDELDRQWLPVVKTWRLNERHYGALEGRNKAEMVELYGREQVFQWRRSYQTRPPALSVDDPRHPRHDPRYAGVNPADLPSGESLEDTLLRVLPYWEEEILTSLQDGQQVLVVAHGNSLRALVKYLDHIPDQDIHALAIPTGIPIVYQLDRHLRITNQEYAGDPQVVEAALKVAARAAQVTGNTGGDSG